MQKLNFKNAKTQFTGDLLAWSGRAMRSKKTPVTLIFGDVKWLITTVNDRPWTQITLLKGFGCFQ